jgi:hypothetical protein
LIQLARLALEITQIIFLDLRFPGFVRVQRLLIAMSIGRLISSPSDVAAE